MAKITLREREIIKETLPEVCIQCGQPSHHAVDKKYTWYPPWVNLFVLFGLLPAVIVIMAMQKRMTMTVHLCETHQNYFRNHKLAVWLPFLGVLLIGAVAFGVIANKDQQQNALVGQLCVASLAAGIIWLFFVAIKQQFMLRTTRITDRSMTLVNVSEAYIDAVEESRELLEQMSPKTKRRLREEEEDDEEDDRPRRKRRRDEDDD